MILYKAIPFTFDGKDYEVKIFHDENLLNVVAFKNNYPANGFRHQIKFPKSASVKKMLGHEVIDEYVEMCKKDISEKRWERLME